MDGFTYSSVKSFLFNPKAYGTLKSMYMGTHNTYHFNVPYAFGSINKLNLNLDSLFNRITQELLLKVYKVIKGLKFCSNCYSQYIIWELFPINVLLNGINREMLRVITILIIYSQIFDICETCYRYLFCCVCINANYSQILISQS